MGKGGVVKNNNFKIKEPSSGKKIDKNVIREESRPVFCFRYLQKTSINKCKDTTFFRDFLFRLQKLSELGWKEICIADRHGYGFERLPLSEFVPKKHPAIITPDVAELTVFRSNGNNRIFAGIRDGNIFRIIYIESDHGDICSHNGH